LFDPGKEWSGLQLARAVPLSYQAIMLSVIIETGNDEEGLARTLATLVSGAVEGLVRDVVVCDSGSVDGTRAVADHAGCVWIDGGIGEAVLAAKGDWLLLLEPGARLLDGWTEAVAIHAARSAMAARFSRDRSLRTPFLARVFRRPGPLTQGLILPRGRALALSGHAGNAGALGRGLAVRTLPAVILPAPSRNVRERLASP
jgi:glycosyltransferase involved in cell wall biosynthesis